jgi:DNA-binding response OmpR family regulator
MTDSMRHMPPEYLPPESDKVPSSLNVLIIEDDELVSMRLELLLEEHGHGSLSVTSVAQANQALSAVYFPVLIVDRMLSDGDGMELCRRFRASHPDKRVYIMMLTALDSEADVAAGMQAGADAYVSKRASDEELLGHLKKATEVIYLPPKL